MTNSGPSSDWLGKLSGIRTMLKSLPGQIRHWCDKDPAVYDVSQHTVQSSGPLPSKSLTDQYSIAEITDHLYLCSAKAVNQGALIALGITHVINCTTAVPHVNLPGVKNTRISIEDRPRCYLGRYFNKVSNKIRKEYVRGGKTLVHCYAGVSRSASLCIAYLMKYYRLNLKNAYLRVEKQRPIVNPNVGFWQQLINYERKLYGYNSVTMVNTRKGAIPDVYWFQRAPDVLNIQQHRGAIRPGIHNSPLRTFMVTLV